MHGQQNVKVSQFIYFCKTHCMFQTSFPSIIRSSKLHIQRQVFVRPILLPPASLARLAAGSSIAPDDGRKNRLKHVERLTEINKLWNVLLVVLCECISDARTYEYWTLGRHHQALKIVQNIREYIIIHSFIHSLVFSLRGRAGRNQSPVMRPVWLWHTASWASSWG